MSKTNTITAEKETSIERALSMYRETVSPPRSILINVLNQIPEIQELPKGGVSVRSPYIWIIATQAVSLFLMVVSIYPTLSMMTDTRVAAVEFDLIDKQIASYEAGIDTQDTNSLLIDYSDTNL
jgi:hypothetical protein